MKKESKTYLLHYEKEVKFYADNFFLDDGTPKYYHNRVYPIDVHAPSQALVFFSLLGAEYRDLCDRIARWMIENLCDSIKGCFYFQKNNLWTNKISYMRWLQAWAFHGLTSYALMGGDDRSS